MNFYSVSGHVILRDVPFGLHQSAPTFTDRDLLEHDTKRLDASPKVSKSTETHRMAGAGFILLKSNCVQ